MICYGRSDLDTLFNGVNSGCLCGIPKEFLLVLRGINTPSR